MLNLAEIGYTSLSRYGAGVRHCNKEKWWDGWVNTLRTLLEALARMGHAPQQGS